tara:strand:- start:494 stop:1009 length:516 start_codon:yes stop_codon:yes gene_type:complete
MAIQENSKGKNVKPLSSVLNITTMDVDCSAMTNAPLDGEFVNVEGHGQPVNAGGTTCDVDAPNLCMVWSHKDQSDLQATGRKRVPVVWLNNLHCTLQLFDDTGTPAAGMALVAVASATADSVTRIMAKPIAWTKAAMADDAIIVGKVVRKISASEIECIIYGQSICSDGAA